MKTMKDIHLLILRKIKLSGGISESLLIEFIEEITEMIPYNTKSDSYYMIFSRFKQSNLISIEKSQNNPTQKMIKLTDKGQEYLNSIHELYSPSVSSEKVEKSQKPPIIIKDSGLAESILETISTEMRIDKERSLKILDIFMKDIRAFLKKNNIIIFTN